MTSAYTIRTASPGDIDCLADIELRAAALFGDVLPEHVRTSVTPLGTLRRALRSGMLLLAVDEEGRPVGFALTERVSDTRVHLEELDVSPDHGRKGVGSMLLAAVESRAAAQGFSEVTLTTFADLPWNAPFHQRRGFVAVVEGQLDAHLRETLAQDAAHGLDGAERVAMRKYLPAVQLGHQPDKPGV